MDQRRQGSICIALGLSLFGIYLLLDRRAAEREGAPGFGAGAADSRTRNEVAAGARREYRGEYELHVAGKRQTFSWTVTVFELPKGVDGTRPVIIHSHEWPHRLSPWEEGGGSGRKEPIDHVLVAWLDGEGRPCRWNATSEAELTLRPIHALLLGTYAASASAHQEAPWCGPDGSPWALEEPWKPSPDPSCRRYMAVAESLSDRVLGVDRRVCLDVQRHSAVVVEMRCHSRAATTDHQCESRLVLAEQTALPVERTEAIAADLESWAQCATEGRRLIELSATGDATSGPELAERLREHERCLWSVRDGCRDEVTRLGLIGALLSPTMSHHRLVRAAELADRLRAGGAATWCVLGADDREYRAEDFRGRVVILGCSVGIPEQALSMFDTLVELRKRWSRDQVGIAVVSAHYQIERMLLLQGAMGDLVTVVREHPRSEPVCGDEMLAPCIVVLDQQGQLEMLHAWQPCSGSAGIARRVDELLSGDSSSNAAPPVIASGAVRQQLTVLAP